MQTHRMQAGFSLMEVMIAVSLSTLLMSAVIQLLSGSVSAYRLQLSQSQLEQSSRYARDVIVSHISQAGYQPEPWLDQPPLPALTVESIDGGQIPGDQLGLQRWSRRNCHGNENPVGGKDGNPRFYLLQVRLRVNGSQNLALTCRYGPDASRLKTQINNMGLIEDVESMQVLYAEDRNDDDIADGWVKAREWQLEGNIRAVKVALLLATEQVFDQPVSKLVTLLDETIATPADGHLRKTSVMTTAIRGRQE